jgi:hypothetical protein
LFTAHVTGNFVTLAAALVSGSHSVVGKMLALPEFVAVIALAEFVGRGLSTCWARSRRAGRSAWRSRRLRLRRQPQGRHSGKLLIWATDPRFLRTSQSRRKDYDAALLVFCRG